MTKGQQKKPAASENYEKMGWRDRNKNTAYQKLKEAGQLPSFITKAIADAPAATRNFS